MSQEQEEQEQSSPNFALQKRPTGFYLERVKGWVSGMFLEGIWRVSGKCLECAILTYWKDQTLFVTINFFEHNFFLYPKFLQPKFYKIKKVLGPKFFWDSKYFESQHFLGHNFLDFLESKCCHTRAQLGIQLYLDLAGSNLQVGPTKWHYYVPEATHPTTQPPTA